MSGVAGVEIRAAIKKTLTWGAAAACGANDGILILPASLKKDAGVDIDDSLGTFFSKDGTPGEIKVEGDMPLYARYDSLDTALALFMGIAGAPTQQGLTSAYAYTYKLKENTDGLFATFAKNMKNYIEEHPSLKIAGLTLKGETGKALQIILNCISMNKVIDSSVNTLASFNNVTFFEQANRIRFSEGVFRLNDQSDIALADNNKIYPSSFELTAKRKLKGEHTGEYRTAGANPQDLIDEPANDGQPEITLKIQFPRHAGTTYLSALGSDTRKKMDITFTGAVIEGAYKRMFKIELPHLQMSNVDVVDEQGIIKEPVEFKVHGAVTAPAGMTGITEPFQISGINRRATDPLA